MSLIRDFPTSGEEVIGGHGRRIARLERSVSKKARESDVAALRKAVFDLQSQPGSGPGTVMNWRGAYVGSTTYQENDVVSYGGASYIYTSATPSSGYIPPTNPDRWDVVAEKGDPGTPGADGTDGTDGTDGADGDSAYDTWLAQGNTGSEADFLADLTGPPGPTGAAASVSVGTTVTGLPGTTATVTATGTATNRILNFTIPRGDTGATGPAGSDGDMTIPDYTASTYYPAGSVVRYTTDGVVYIAIANWSSSHDPSANPSNSPTVWQRLDKYIGASTWSSAGISYGSGYSSFSSYPIQYIREGNWVSLRGLIQRSTAWGTSSTTYTSIMTLPSGVRPERDDFFPAIFVGPESTNQRFKVNASGAIDIRLHNPPFSGGYYSLNNVRFWSP